MFLIPSLGRAAAYNDNERALSVAFGIFLSAWCFLAIIFFLAALKTNIAILSVLFFLALAYFFLAIAQFIRTTHLTNAIRVNRVGGAMAVISVLLAFYAGSSGIMRPETTFIRLPVGKITAFRETRQQA